MFTLSQFIIRLLYFEAQIHFRWPEFSGNHHRRDHRRRRHPAGAAAPPERLPGSPTVQLWIWRSNNMRWDRQIWSNNRRQDNQLWTFRCTRFDAQTVSETLFVKKLKCKKQNIDVVSFHHYLQATTPVPPKPKDLSRATRVNNRLLQP